MDSTLLSGRYTSADAEKLLTNLFNVKKNFHSAKIGTVAFTEEDIKHSEKRIIELDAELKRILAIVKNGNYSQVNLNAKIVFDCCP